MNSPISLAQAATDAVLAEHPDLGERVGRTASRFGSCGFTGSRSTPDTAGTPILYANASTVG